MADDSFVSYLRRFLNKSEILEAYKLAGQAYMSNNTEVVITGSSLDGTSHSGEFIGDPEKIMRACEFLLDEMEAIEAGVVQKTATGAMDFSKRILGT